MRTLKKALSLVLVLAMVFALAVPGFAADTTKKAADFKDYSKVTNKEAVDVLTAIGVINGNTDGTFGPEGNFTRAQAATMITYLTLGKTVANALPTSATKFSDVPATHWAAKYIQYCADAGIVAGVGNGKFDPDAQLTATQWALMLLGALGYKAANEGISGEGWEIATTRLAMKAGVASDSELAGTFNRDMAAKFAFNTLTADVVEYESNGTNITIGDTTISTGASKAKVQDALKEKNDTGALVNRTYAVGADDGKLQFCEQHFSGLKLTTTKVDNYQRTATNWTLNNKPIATGVKAATLTYTTAVKSSKIYGDLGLSKEIAAGKVTLFVDGASATAGTSTNFAITKTGDDKDKTYGGQGVLTEVYYDSANGTVKIIEINTYIGIVTKVNKDTDKTEASIDLKVLNNAGNGTGAVMNVAKATGFNKNDVVLFTKYGATPTVDVNSLTTAKTITGAVSKITNGDTYTIDGTDYKVNAATASNVSMPAVPSKTTYTYYVDANNNIIGNVSAVAQTNVNYILVLGAAAPTQGADYMSTASADFTGKVYGILSNGEKGEFTVNYGSSSTPATKDTLYSYTIEKNQFKLGDSAAKISDEELKTNQTALNSKVLNSETLFVFFSQTTEGSVEVTNLTTKTGNANIGATVADKTSKWVGAFSGSKSNVAEVVFVKTDYAEASAVVDYAYISAATGTYTTTNVLKADGTSDTTYTYTAYTANGDELKLTSGSSVSAGIYRYNDKNEIGAQVTTDKYTVTAVNGSVVSLEKSGVAAKAYNVAGNVYYANNDTALTISQEVYFTTNTAGDVITNMWVVTDATFKAVTVDAAVTDYDVTGEGDYAVGSTVTMTFTQKTASALATGTSVTVTGATGATATVTTAGTTEVKGVITVTFTMPNSDASIAISVA